MLLKKSQTARRQFSCCKKSDRRPRIDVASITLPRLPASLSSGNEVPHIFTRKSRVQPKEILITSAKRLFQQHRSKPEPIVNARTSAFASCGQTVALAMGRPVPEAVIPRRRDRREMSRRQHARSRRSSPQVLSNNYSVRPALRMPSRKRAIGSRVYGTDCSALARVVESILAVMADEIVITEKSIQAKDVRAAVGSRYGDILPAEGHLFDLLEPADVVPATVLTMAAPAELVVKLASGCNRYSTQSSTADGSSKR
jgi:hypothetical protein